MIQIVGTGLNYQVLYQLNVYRPNDLDNCSHVFIRVDKTYS